jgi:hypothetical protein
MLDRITTRRDDARFGAATVRAVDAIVGTQRQVSHRHAASALEFLRARCHGIRVHATPGRAGAPM